MLGYIFSAGYWVLIAIALWFVFLGAVWLIDRILNGKWNDG
jgi:hypothetical protein